MTKRASIEVAVGSRRQGGPRSEDSPVRILYLGDLSGGRGSDADFAVRHVSFETLDQAIGRLAPVVPISLDRPVSVRGELTISAMADFHPDRLVKALPELEALVALKDQLSRPETAASAREQLAELLPGASAAAEAPASPPAGAQAEDVRESDEDTFQRLLGGTSGAKPRTRASATVDALIKDVMGSASAAEPADETGREQGDVAALMTDILRGVLMTPALRDLEQAWRGVDWLVRRLDDELAEISVVDVSREALGEHLRQHAERLDTAPLHRLLCEPPDGEPWDIIVGNHTFGPDPDDIAVLATMGAMAARAGAVFLAHGDLALGGCNSLEAVDAPWDWAALDGEIGELWAAFRGHPAARSVGLLAPRVLLRQPYGPETDPVEAYDFRELPPEPAHERFLWCNPAVCGAYALASVLGEDYSGSTLPFVEIDDLPAPIYDDGTGQAIQPPVEVLMSDRASTALAAAGLNALLGSRGSNAIRADGLVTAALDPTELAARLARG